MIQLMVLASLVSAEFSMGYVEPVMEVLTGAETASKLSYRYDSGNVVSADRHVFQFDLKLGSPAGWTDPLMDEPLSTDFCTYGQVYRRPQPNSPNGWSGTEYDPPPLFFVLWPAPPPFTGWINAERVVAGGPNEYLGVFSPHQHDGREDDREEGAPRPGNTSYEFYILSPGESGITMDPAVVPQGPFGALVTALGKPITAEDQIPCHLAAVGPLAGDEVRVLIKTTKTQNTLLGYQDMFLAPNPPGSYYYPYDKTCYLWRRTTTVHYALMTFDIQKLLCEDASIDSRRIDGVPNAEGQLPGADPNAEHRNLNFNPWFFKGGLFIGKMGLFNGDQSGTARIQLYAEGVITEGSRLAVLSMVPLGRPRADISSGITVGAFRPAPNDPFLSVSNDTVTWAERWTPTGFSGSALMTNGTPNPLEYANWQLGISTTGVPAIPGLAVQKTGLMLANEDTSPTPVWCYFSSKEHQALNPTTFPLNDSRPRIWLVNATVTRWDENP